MRSAALKGAYVHANAALDGGADLCRVELRAFDFASS